MLRKYRETNHELTSCCLRTALSGQVLPIVRVSGFCGHEKPKGTYACRQMSFQESNIHHPSIINNKKKIQSLLFFQTEETQTNRSQQPPRLLLCLCRKETFGKYSTVLLMSRHPLFLSEGGAEAHKDKQCVTWGGKMYNFIKIQIILILLTV